MRSIRQTDRVLSISHEDMDGTVCQIVLSNVFMNINFIDTQFVKVGYLLRDLNWEMYNHVFLTDVYPDNPQVLDRIGNLVFLDHHDTALPLIDVKRSRFVDSGQCAASLTKNFCEEYFKLDLSHLNDLVRLTNDYDLWVHDDPKSKDLNILWSYYKSHNFRRRFYLGNVEFSEEEKTYLEYKHADYQVKFDELEICDLEFVKGCVAINVENYINEFCEDLMIKFGYKIVFVIRKNSQNISVRHCIEGLHIGNLLRKLEYGGGHANAAGLQEGDPKLAFRKIQNIEEHIFTHFKSERLKGK